MIEEDLSYKIRGAIYEVYNYLGIGLLESVYTNALKYELERRGLKVCKEVALPVLYKEITLDVAFRLDLLVEDKAIIGALVKGGANEQVLKVDDKILELDGKKITLWADIPEVTKEALDKKELSAIIERDGKEEKLVLKLTKDEENNRVVLGISPKSKKTNLSFTESLIFAKNSFVSILKDTVGGLFTLFSGKADLKEISGPVGILKVVGEVSKFGWTSIASLAVILSINIGVLNLLPIPALDGGRIIFVLLELFRIKVNKKWEENLHKFGMVVLLFFIVMISVNDVWKLFN